MNLKESMTGTPTPVTYSDFVSFGSTRLDLASTSRLRCGLAKGTYALLVGDSSSGKTWLGRSVLAQASINSKFKKYKLIHGNAENGAWMDVGRYFGPALEERLEEEHPFYAEEFYYRLDDLFKAGQPFIYLLDSENALTTKADEEQQQEEKKAHEKGGEAESGTYGTAKAKCHSTHLRGVCNRLHESGSILMIISQTRQNIGPAARFNPKTRSGGKALKFFAHLELWTSVKEDIQTKLGKGSGLNTDKQRKQGIIAKVKIEKNRFTGREGEVEIPIYNSFGIDDVGSMVDWLLEENHWKKETGGYIICPEFDCRLRREALIGHIEEDDLIPELQLITAKVWKKIEEAISINRRSPYAP